MRAVSQTYARVMLQSNANLRTTLAVTHRPHLASARMDSSRVLRVVIAVFVALGAVATLSACAEDETIVAVNVSSTDEVGNPNELVITISQSEQTPVVREIDPPTRTQDSGVSIQPTFYERVALPDSWKRAKSEVKVEARDSRGVYLSAATEITVRPGGAVAAFVDLGKKPEMTEPEDDAGTAADGGS
jgi:hypothetical protein